MVKKRTLLFLAALVWLAAGVNIMRIGVIAYSGHLTLLAAAGSVVVFVLFGFFSAFFVSSQPITVGCVIISVAVFLRQYISRDKNEPFSVSFFYINPKKEKE